MFFRRFFTLLITFWLANCVFAQSHVGSKVCASCHQQEYQKWQSSHHAKAMAHANADSVLGNFSDQVFTHQGVTTRFLTLNQQFIIQIEEPNQPVRRYPVAYTFGFYPLQQYLLATEKGKYQAYDVAWDSRPQQEGGQRWFKLLPDLDTSASSEFHWSKQLNNWNSRCAECHSTGLEKRFSEKNLAYDTRYQEINVACEACHGAGEDHVNAVNAETYKKGEKTGFTTQLNAPHSFVFADRTSSIAKPASKQEAKKNQQQLINACGGCHSRRQIISETDPAKSYHDQYRLTLLEESLYHRDGQILDEVFVLGSFMQSKMHEQGVACHHCHDSHSGQVKAQDNSLCTQCHQPGKYDNKKHHKHMDTSAGAQCVACHMPETTYMGVDDRRDHGFFVPKAGEVGACGACHDQSTKAWGKTQSRFEQVNQQAQAANPLALRDVVDYINDPTQASIRRATLMEQVANIPSRLSAETIFQQLKSEDSMLRRAAVDACAMLPLEMRWSVLKNHLQDESESVRYSIVEQLAPVWVHISEAEKLMLEPLIQEHRIQLSYSNDLPAGQGHIADFERNLGNTAGAIKALNLALKIEPNYLPARLNLADIYRDLQNIGEEKLHLQKALSFAPKNPAVNHSYGLFLIRQQQKKEAMPYLKQAALAEESQPRFNYVYAVALESMGEVSDAINTLKQANTRWPNQYNLLLTLIMYLEKANRAEESWPYLSTLSALAPNDPEVKRRVQALQKSDRL